MYKAIVDYTFLGTGHHRTTHDTTIRQAFEDIKRHAQQPNSQVVARLFDGPGCAGSEQDPRPGTYVYENQTKKIESTPVISEWLHRAHEWVKEQYKALTGIGVESSLLEATLF